MVDVLTKSTPEGSFLQHMESSIVCLQSGFLIGPVGDAAAIDLVGYPVKGTPAAGFTLALEADSAAGITGWIVESGFLTLAAAAVTPRKYRILAVGPAAVAKESLPVADAAGTNFTQANLIAALEAAGIKVLDAPGQTSVQVKSAEAPAEEPKKKVSPPRK